VSVDQVAESPNLQQQLQEDPYPLYALWRKSGRVQWMEGMDHWFVLGHQEAMTALREVDLVGPARADLFAHGRVRRLAQSVFTPALVEQLRTDVTALAADAARAMQGRGDCDLVADFASPLAVSVATLLLGLPTHGAESTGAWLREISSGLMPSLGHCQRMPMTGTVTAPPELQNDLAAVLAARRTIPGDDLVGRLAAVEIDGDRLGDAELLDLCVEIVVSAHDTTVDLLGNGIKALLDNPVQLDWIRADPGLVTSGVEELLRYDSPIQIVARHAASDVDLAGQRIRAGQPVMVMIGAANRDPDAFDGADVLDISRSPNHHVSFGRGMRTCLGAPVARLTGQVAIGTLAAGFPGLRQAGTPTRRSTVGSRGFTSFPITL